MNAGIIQLFKACETIGSTVCMYGTISGLLCLYGNGYGKKY